MNIFGDEWHSLMIEVFTASFVDSDPSSTGGLFSCELETLSSWNLFDNAKLLTETPVISSQNGSVRIAVFSQRKLIMDDCEKFHFALKSSLLPRFVYWKTLLLFTQSCFTHVHAPCCSTCTVHYTWFGFADVASVVIRRILCGWSRCLCAESPTLSGI